MHGAEMSDLTAAVSPVLVAAACHICSALLSTFIGRTAYTGLTEQQGFPKVERRKQTHIHL